MPRFDGTGPMGQGPMSGRGMGYCAVPVSRLASGPMAVAATANPYYPMGTYPAWAGRYMIPWVGYPRRGRRLWFGYGRGRGRGKGRGRWW
jgi:hypothetical protein